MKRLIFIFICVVLISGCNKTTSLDNNEVSSEAPKGQSTSEGNSAKVEEVNDNKTEVKTEKTAITAESTEKAATEEKQIVWRPICPEFESISVEINGKTITHKIDKTTDVTELTDVPYSEDIEKCLKMTIENIPKGENVGKDRGPWLMDTDKFFSYVEDIVSENTGANNSEKNIILDKIDGQTFVGGITLKSSFDNTIHFSIKYHTTTPNSKIRITFYYNNDDELMTILPHEAPQYFQKFDYGPYGWKDRESVDLMIEKLIDGTVESSTLNRIYNNIKQIVSNIKIQVE